MHRVLSYLLAAFFLLLPLSCIRENVESVRIADGEPVEFDLSFGAGSLENVLVTKSTLGEQAESAIYNLYVFIFDADGNKFYGKLFDGDNLGSKPAHSSDWWTISNQSSSVAATSGTIHIRSLAKGDGCKIVVIANIDAEMLSMSAEQLKTVSKWSDLQNIKVKLNQVMVSRSGHFPMTGVLENVSITRVPDTTTSTIKVGDSDASVSLKRLDAKIVFNVRVAAGASISSFSPMTWNVVNVPMSSYLLERGQYGTSGPFIDSGASSSDYFETASANFESETPTDDTYAGTDQHHISVHSFSFYMLESRLSPKLTPETYADRERQEKIPLSAGRVKNGDFLYAHDWAPYVEFSGRLQMSATSDASTLSAEVHYRVHLGDFGSNLADFCVFRNHTYVYNISIQGVDDIRTEVEGVYDENGDLISGPEEREPGASGEVSVSRETVLTSDAHYSTHVITFHADNIDASRVTWDVVTPFNPKGATPTFTPEGNEVTAGIDYEWVEFRKNERNPEDNNYYKNKRQTYRPRKGPNSDPVNPTMTVSELVAYLKEQKSLYDHGEDNDFDNDSDGPKIVVTAFLNEYYYETNPITGKYEPDLWKKVVNQPMRYMHILSETKSSADGESRVIGASFTIEQKSIQTIYNVNAEGLNSAWGSEHTDDEQILGVSGSYWSSSSNEERGNTSLSNGRENTFKEWNLVDKDGNPAAALGQSGYDVSKWSTYLQLDADNETPYIMRNYRYLRYSCMSRNRDNDGDGVIDEDEVRWYMAAENQLMGLFLGSYGIEGDARLYQRSAEQMASNKKDDWRQHVVASTVNAHGTGNYAGKNSNKFARVIWAEEGTSGSSLAYTGSTDQTSTFSVRCVRNIGHDPSTGGSITFSSYHTESDPVIVHHRMKNQEEYSGEMDADVYYVFDCTRLNKASLRYYTSSELVSHNEFSEQACLYSMFEAASRGASVVLSKSWSAREMTEWLDSDSNKGKANQFCPAGYRMCNLRELLLLRYFIPMDDVKYYFNQNNHRNLSRTWWFFGANQPVSSYRKSNDHWGFANNSEKTEKAGNSQKSPSIRCVRDIKQ